MATIRGGDKAVLLIVDVQEGVLSSAFEPERIIGNIQVILGKARSGRIPVIWVQHSDKELAYQSPSWEIITGLTINAGEYRIDKRYNSSFEETDLDRLLAKIGATEIVLAGAQTNWCIRATAYGALERGYDLSLISDAHTTESIDMEDGKKIAARDIIEELNVAISWLRYPGRRNQSVKANEYSFEKKREARRE
jgi:nicotinamidase-related amidase